ncbi:hypothetical protein LUZ60_012759 [Juncus effusus]|nr:hypothetical protein LUZ60_012759 [Juncus effusus]
MKEACSVAKAEVQKLSCSAAAKFLLFVIAVLSVLNQSMMPQSRSEGLGESNKWPSPVEETQNIDTINSNQDGDNTRLLVKIVDDQTRNEPVLDDETLEEIRDNANLPKTGIEMSIPTNGTDEKSEANSSLTLNELEKSGENNTVTPKSSLTCDYSNRRFDICSLEGDVRVLGTASSVLLISPTSNPPLNTTSYKIRPFTRKWEDVTMSRVRELTLQQSDSETSPACDVTHDVPVVIFDMGGFPFNLFHAYTDLLMPLFIGSYQYNGKVQFAATSYNLRWVQLYLPLLTSLSHYPILNLDSETLVHCFPSAQVGIKSHGPLAIDPNMSTNGYTMQDFRQFVRTSVSLQRAQVEIIDKNSGKRPRLCILLRKGTRAFINENEIIGMAEEMGFEVVPTDTETTKLFPKIAHIINSCDVLMGLHGAGMANMLYLPNNGTLIQILPWGNLRDIGWGDYGAPTKDMGVKYVEYEIKVEESTLLEKYPRDDVVFTNPQEIHKHGWNAMYNVYLVEQNVKLDVDRFRGVLLEIFKSLTQQ